jgi:hypothetical protein
MIQPLSLMDNNMAEPISEMWKRINPHIVIENAIEELEAIEAADNQLAIIKEKYRFKSKDEEKKRRIIFDKEI